MVKIAYCDDDASALQQFRLLLEQYRASHETVIEYTPFGSPLDLLAAVERGTQFDILFLDILMPGENGMEAAEEIRLYDKNVKIIFLSTSTEYGVQSYGVSAYYYLLKPVREDSLFPLLDRALATCEREQGSGLLLRCRNGITRILPHQLAYCEVIHRTLFLHFADGTVLECAGSLNDLSEKLLPFGDFLRPHRSFLVNPASIKTLSYRAVTMMDGTEIPLPRGKCQEIKSRYLAYVFAEDGQ